MEQLIFSIHASFPVFLLMLAGMLCRRVGWMDERLAGELNRFVFRLPLPLLLFYDLSTVDFYALWDGRFVLFCALVTLTGIGGITLLSYLCCSRRERAEFIQASYRSSAALLGIALIQNIYGSAGLAPMMIIGSVPLYNMLAVVILSVFHEEKRRPDRRLMMRTLRGIATNPIILGILAGILWSALRLPLPVIMNTALRDIAATATPLGLISMGAAFNLQKAGQALRPVLIASFLKLVGLCAVFLPLAVLFGFRQQQLTAILVMLGSASTVSCYVMARSMGHEGTISSAAVMLSTLLSAFTLTAWLWLLRTFALI